MIEKQWDDGKVRIHKTAHDLTRSDSNHNDNPRGLDESVDSIPNHARKQSNFCSKMRKVSLDNHAN